MPMSFGERLATARRRANITQENFAKVLGVSRQSVSKWESDLALPESDKLPRIAKILNISLDELMGVDSGEPEPLEPPEQSASSQHTIVLNLRTASFEYKSKKTVRGMPLVHISVGFGKRARGIVAIGNNATGVIALGLLARGVLPLGLFSLGVIPFGLFSIGLLALGTIALGVLAAGAIACGVLAAGAIAIGCYAVGALAIGLYGALGDHAISASGIAVGKTFAKGANALFPKESFSKATLTALTEQIKTMGPVPLRPLAALFALFLSCIA